MLLFLQNLFVSKSMVGFSGHNIPKYRPRKIIQKSNFLLLPSLKKIPPFLTKLKHASTPTCYNGDDHATRKKLLFY